MPVSLYGTTPPRATVSARICDELYRRGIDRELWDAALDELPETDDTVDRLLGAKLRGDVSPEGLQRAQGYLLRRGYSWDDIRAATERYLCRKGHTMNNSSTVAMISLGCPKNLVNSEEMLALLQDAGYAFTDDLAKADAVIINTCAFIEDRPRPRPLKSILETASYREENPELKTHRLRLSCPTLCRAISAPSSRR